MKVKKNNKRQSKKVLKNKRKKNNKKYVKETLSLQERCAIQRSLKASAVVGVVFLLTLIGAVISGILSGGFR